MIEAFFLWLHGLHPAFYFVAAAWLGLCIAFILVVIVLLVNARHRKPAIGHFGPVSYPRAPGGHQER